MRQKKILAVNYIIYIHLSYIGNMIAIGMLSLNSTTMLHRDRWTRASQHPESYHITYLFLRIIQYGHLKRPERTTILSQATVRIYNIPGKINKNWCILGLNGILAIIFRVILLEIN